MSGRTVEGQSSTSERACSVSVINLTEKRQRAAQKAAETRRAKAAERADAFRRSVPPVRSPLAERAAQLFGLPIVKPSGPDRPRPAWADQPVEVPRPGEVLLLAGPSGGGKSTRLRAIAASSAVRTFDVARVRLRPVPCVDQFGCSRDPAADLKHAAGLLARVGLAEAFVFLRLPSELSDGQRWRLRLAIVIHRVMRHNALRDDGALPLIVADEFGAVLDRVTACTVARSLRRTIDRLTRVGVSVAAAVATSHDDLERALLPDRVDWCEIGVEAGVSRRCSRAC